MLAFVQEEDTPGERLKKLRAESRLSLREAAKLSEGGITHAHISHLENDPAAWSKVSYEKLKALARAYNMPLQGFLGRINGTPYPAKPNIYTDQAHLESADIHQGRRRIPVYDLVSAGPGSDGGTVVSYIDLEPELKGEHQAYRISGDSMSPQIEDGDVVVVEARNYASPDNTIVCWTPEEGMLCKRLDRLDDGYYVLTSTNPGYRPIWTREIRIYGIVVQIRKRLKVINGSHS